MAETELLFKSIPEIGALYRSKAISPLEITRLTLDRIAQLNPSLNAFISLTSEKALEQASRAERELHTGVDRGALHGIPIALKDLIDTAGIRTTCGSRILRDQVPKHDAIITTRLEESGAVLVGKTNLLEFAFGIVHADYGQTNNPYDLNRTAGGSSGGSAAAVAAGLCFAAVGTDTGGSIRIPASYCGVAGLKPSYGLTSLSGVFPLSWSLDHAGPIARSSRDARLMLEAMTGLILEHPARIKNMRFGVLQREGRDMQPAVIAAFDAAAQALRGAGATVQTIEIPDLELADAALLNVLLPEASVIHAPWIESRPEDYSPLTRMQIELGFAIPAVTHVRAQQFRRHLTRQFLLALRGLDAILSPTVAFVAPKEDPLFAVDAHGVSEGRRTSPYNLCGLPALSVNCGFGDHGLPVGIQIVTRPHEDALALAIGGAIEALMPEARPVPNNDRGIF